MLRRRDFLRGLASTAALPVAAACAQPGPAEADAGLARSFDQILDVLLRRSPEIATEIGLDRGARATARSQLDDRSIARALADRREDAEILRGWQRIDRSALSTRAAIQYDTYHSILTRQTAVHDRLGDIAGTPYVLTPFDGLFQKMPGFLDTKHPLETRADADAYLARLAALPAALDQETERLRHDGAKGVIPPDFVVDLILGQIQELANEAPAQSSLVVPLVKRAAQRTLAGEFEAPATAIYQRDIQPALGRQIDELRSLRTRASPDAGIWKIRNGEALYEALLAQATMTAMSAADVHALGLERVRSIEAEIDAAMRAQGLSGGSVGARLHALFEDQRFRYPNTEESKAAIIDDVNARLRRIDAELPRGFRVLPRAQLTVKRIPPAIEGGSFFAYYDNPSFDGARPGIFWLNLLDTSETPKWLIPTIVHHEGIPGHHLQAALAQETAGLPDALKAIEFFGSYSVYTANSEGWATYAEQLADEWGFYDGDPWARIGYLHDALLRAARMVVDTGIHALRWDRERALRYFVEHLGDPERKLRNEITRYCVWPGQACSYEIGKLTWLRLRERARRELGSRFNVRAFHDAGLRVGPVPLAVLEGVIGDYIRGAR